MSRPLLFYPHSLSLYLIQYPGRQLMPCPSADPPPFPLRIVLTVLMVLGQFSLLVQVQARQRTCLRILIQIPMYPSDRL